MGNKLAEFRDRVIHGYIVKHDGMHAGSAQYKLFTRSGLGTAEGHPGSPTSPIQVTLGDPGDPLPRLRDEPGEIAEEAFTAPIDECPRCQRVEFLKYSAAGALYCALCDLEG